MSHSNSPLSNYKMTVSYDGQNFFGWQRHGNKPTVQYALEEAVEQAFNVHVPVQGSGRTDRGAHALGQVANLQLPIGLEPEAAKKKLNDFLPAEVRIVEMSSTSPDFHACNSAIAKRYRYVIWNDHKLPADRHGRVWYIKEPLDLEAMKDACSIFVGEHDFSSFATRPNFKQKVTRRTVTEAVLTHNLPTITFEITADGFLYKMVRNIVRAIVKVGEGRYTRDKLRHILESKDRKASPGTAPASGLYLDRVFYAEDTVGEASREETPK